VAEARAGAVVSNMYAFTAVSIDLSDVPERIHERRRPMAGLATPRGIRGVQYLGQATEQLRAAVQVAMDGELGAQVRADAQRIGALVVLGYEGAPLRETLDHADVANELADLRRRLALLEGTHTAVDSNARHMAGVKM